MIPEIVWIVLDKFFESVSIVGKVVDKSLPSPEMQKEIYDDKKADEEAKRMDKYLRQATRHFVFRPKQRKDIDTYVDLKHQSLSTEQRERLKKLVHSRFEKK